MGGLITEKQIPVKASAPGHALLSLQQFSFSYPDQKKKTLENITLSLKDGSFTILCGSSGCGKSTLLRQLKTVLKPHGTCSGNITWRGRDQSELSDREESSLIGFVMQDPDAQIVTDKVWHELAFGLESLGYDTPTIRLRVAEMASYFGIQGWFYKNVEELSGGQKQLLNLASVMAMHPALLILDEPTSQLDPIAASDFLETIKKINRDLGTTILLTEHRLEDVFPSADQAILMDQGKILFSGTPTETGLWMYEHQHPMFEAMPAPLKIFAQAAGKKDELGVPLTVREGRQWIDLFINQNTRLWTDQPVNKNTKPLTDQPVLELKDIWFRYDRDLPDILKGVNLALQKGEIYCLLGGNGTGKSTTLSLMSRIRKPYRGRILLAGKDIRKYSEHALYREFLGVMPQNPQSLFVKKTVKLELFEMIGGSRQKINEDFPFDLNKEEVVMNMASLTHLEHLLSQHPFDLSGGEQQRLALAKILLLRPQLLLMDEPTKGMDACFKAEFASILQKLRDHGITIFIISHDIEFCARYADRCGLFFDGSIVTENTADRFFAGNSFYTTSVNRMVRHIWPDAITPSQVLEHLLN